MLPRMNSQNNEEFELEVGIESEYHDFGDDEVIHHQYASPLSTSPVKRGIAKSEKQEEFGMATFSQWSSSYFG